jgi:ATP-dependent Clp protease ATP-binding subunit ClpC
MISQEEARRLGHGYVGTEQLLLGLVGERSGLGSKALKSVGLDLKKTRFEVEKIIGRGPGLPAAEVPFTPRCKRVLEVSLDESRRLGHNYIGTEHLVLGILRENEGVAVRVLENLGVDFSLVRDAIIRSLAEQFPAPAVKTLSRNFRALAEFGNDLTVKASQGGVDPVIGRSVEIERVVQILGRRQKNNPVLIGEPGVGKTAIAEGLASRIMTNDVPDTLEGKAVVSLDLGLMIAGTKYRGEFEERLKKLMEDVQRAKNVILLIDEVHTLVGAGAAEGAVDAANILKPALSRGELQCIGATTIDEYRKHIESDAALERRFQPVMVGEPSVPETIDILYGIREKYEVHHKLEILDEAVEAAAKYSDQYISDRFLPDKAIDLIDEAGSRVRLMGSQLPPEARKLEEELRLLLRSKDKARRSRNYAKAEELKIRELEMRARLNAYVMANKKTKTERNNQDDDTLMVVENDIAYIVAAWTGIPVNKLSMSEAKKLMQMEKTLHSRIIGQDEAVVAVSRAIRRARVGLKNPNRPIASFIFSGPTGVGKTELTKALASYFFGSEGAMVRLDMSEYMERHSVSKLIGSPPGYIGYRDGGQLTEAVRRKPYTVVLFDEVEKAHFDIFNVMLQIFEDGRLTDSKGRTADFKNTLLIMTSNVGSKVIEKGSDAGFDSYGYGSMAQTHYQRVKGLVNEELKQYFRPEFLNRLDEIIVFQQLGKMEVDDIAKIMLGELRNRLAPKGIRFDVTDRFRTRLVQQGFDPAYGARPLRRAIQRILEDNLAEQILSGKIKSGDYVIADVAVGDKVALLIGEQPSNWEPPEIQDGRSANRSSSGNSGSSGNSDYGSSGVYSRPRPDEDDPDEIDLGSGRPG